MSNQIIMLEKIISYDHKFNNNEINEAFSSFRDVFSEKIKLYESPEKLIDEVSVEDEVADFSVLLLNAIDIYDDIEDEVEVRTFLEMIWENQDESS